MLYMHDATDNPRATDTDLLAEPTCCPGGACGPIFETPLLELAFNRIRDLVRGRSAADAARAAARSPVDPLVLTQPAAPAPLRHPQEQASHE